MTKTSNFNFAAYPSARVTVMQEFAAALLRTGACTVAEMHDRASETHPPVRLLKVEVNESEAKELTEMARRLGYVEAVEDARRATGEGRKEPEWALTERGLALPAPRSLAVIHVVASIVRLADPVRREAGDWVPALALLLGVTAAGAATQDAEATTQAAKAITSETVTEVARWISIGVLAVVLAIHAHGELQLHRFAKAGRNMRGRRSEQRELYATPRVVVLSLAAVSQVACYACAIFGDWSATLWLAAVAAVLLISQFLAWHRPALSAQGDRWVRHIKPWR